MSKLCYLLWCSLLSYVLETESLVEMQLLSCFSPPCFYLFSFLSLVYSTRNYFCIISGRWIFSRVFCILAFLIGPGHCILFGFDTG